MLKLDSITLNIRKVYTKSLVAEIMDELNWSYTYLKITSLQGNWTVGCTNSSYHKPDHQTLTIVVSTRLSC